MQIVYLALLILYLFTWVILIGRHRGCPFTKDCVQGAPDYEAIPCIVHKAPNLLREAFGNIRFLVPLSVILFLNFGTEWSELPTYILLATAISFRNMVMMGVFIGFVLGFARTAEAINTSIDKVEAFMEKPPQ